MKRCLIVDDSPVIRKVARRILETEGYEIAEAENGQEALERVKRQVPDVTLLDWQMPVMGAHELLAALRVSLSGRRPYIIYWTTENDPGDVARALAAGADDFMLKPFDRMDLVGKMSAVSCSGSNI
jgi:two-component system chemotaxis response regulator CheY